MRLGCRVMHGTAQQCPEVGVDTRGVLVVRGRCDAGQQVGVPAAGRALVRPGPAGIDNYGIAANLVRAAGFGGRKVPGVGQAQWRKHVVLHVVIQGLAGQVLDQRAQNDEVDVRVMKSAAGVELEGTVQGAGDTAVAIGGRQAPGALVTQVATEPGGMGQQHPQRHFGPARIVPRVEFR